jgi:hypothetical protein
VGPPDPGLPDRSGKDVAGGSVDFVPVGAAEVDFTGVGHLLNTVRAGRSEDGLNLGRVALNPGDGHAGFGDAVGGAEVVENLV